MKKLILILLIFTLTGCWNYNKLNNLAIATGFAVDIVDDQFEVTVLISNSQKQGSGDSNASASSVVYSGKGDTIFEAIKDSSLGISKQIYISHIEVLVLSEKVAQTKTKEVIDFFFRYPQTRNEFLMVIAKDCKAGDTFKVTASLETFPSQNISKNLEITNELQGYTYTTTFNNFVKAIIEEGKNPVVPTITIIGDVEEGNKESNIEQNKPNTFLKLDMMSIFNGFNLVGISNKDQSKGINLINDKVTTTLINNKYHEGNVVIEIRESKTDVSVEIKDNKPKFKINIKSEGSIEEVTTDIKIEEENVIKEIKKLSEEEIKRIANIAIEYAKETKTDIFGFGNLIYKKEHKYWKEIKDKWQEELLNQIEVEITANLDLKTKGKIDMTIEVN